MKNLLIVLSLFAAGLVFAGATNFVIPITVGTAPTGTVVWSTNCLAGIKGPVTALRVRISGADCYYTVNSPVTNNSPIVQANSVDNWGGQTYPMNSVTNICAKEVGATGNATAHVWCAWTSIPIYAPYP